RHRKASEGRELVPAHGERCGSRSVLGPGSRRDCRHGRRRRAHRTRGRSLALGAGGAAAARAAGRALGQDGLRYSRRRGIPSSRAMSASVMGRVVATEKKPNTAHEFHFWTSLDSPVGIGTIVRVDGELPVNGVIPRVYGIVVEGFSYTDLLSPIHDVLGHD